MKWGGEKGGGRLGVGGKGGEVVGKAMQGWRVGDMQVQLQRGV